MMLWVIMKKIFEILVFIQYGQKCEGGIVVSEEDWHPIIHNDVHAGNILLHWPDENALLPSVLLGDWGTAMMVAGPADRDRIVRADTKILRSDVSMFVNTLIGLSDAGPREIEEERGPIWQVLKLRREALEIARHRDDITITHYYGRQTASNGRGGD